MNISTVKLKPDEVVVPKWALGRCFFCGKQILDHEPYQKIETDPICLECWGKRRESPG